MYQNDDMWHYSLAENVKVIKQRLEMNDTVDLVS